MVQTTRIFFLLLSFLWALAGVSVVPEPFKIGFVNFDVAFSQEHEAHKYTDELGKEEQEILDSEQKARIEIEKKMADFQKTMTKLTDKAKFDQQTALSNEISALQQK